MPERHTLSGDQCRALAAAHAAIAQSVSPTSTSKAYRALRASHTTLAELWLAEAADADPDLGPEIEALRAVVDALRAADVASDAETASDVAALQAALDDAVAALDESAAAVAALHARIDELAAAVYPPDPDPDPEPVAVVRPAIGSSDWSLGEMLAVPLGETRTFRVARAFDTALVWAGSNAERAIRSGHPLLVSSWKPDLADVAAGRHDGLLLDIAGRLPAGSWMVLWHEPIPDYPDPVAYRDAFDRFADLLLSSGLPVSPAQCWREYGDWTVTGAPQGLPAGSTARAEDWLATDRRVVQLIDAYNWWAATGVDDDGKALSTYKNRTPADLCSRFLARIRAAGFTRWGLGEVACQNVRPVAEQVAFARAVVDYCRADPTCEVAAWFGSNVGSKIDAKYLTGDVPKVLIEEGWR